MGTDSKAFFLGVLSDFLQEIPTEETVGVDWEEVFALAKKQSLEAILYHQCRSWLPREEKRKHLRGYLSCAALSFEQAAAFQELMAGMEQEEIPILCMKGAVLRDCYPIPSLRSMGDMDCVVRAEDREKVDRILREDLGFQRFIDNHAVWTYGKGSVYFEVHSHMFYESLTGDVDYRSYFDKVWEHRRRQTVFGVSSRELYVPEESFHFLYLMTHTAKHVTNKGSGFRPYLDMVRMTRRWADRLDWAWITGELEKLELLSFTRTCFALCERWFGVKMPLESAKLDDAFYLIATEKCFRDGLFGLENEENTAAHTAKELKRSHLPRWLASLRLMGEKLFPSYSDMQLIPWYSFVDGRPWLMPAAWIYRWGYCIVHKRKHGTELLSEPIVKKKTIAKREEWLRQWGL